MIRDPQITIAQLFTELDVPIDTINLITDQLTEEGSAVQMRPTNGGNQKVFAG